MNRHLREAYAALDRIEKAVPMDSLEAIRECRMALELLAGKRKRIAQKLPGTSRKAAKEAKRRRHMEETARIREERMRMADGRCEAVVSMMLMGHMESIRCGADAVHMHHLLPGNGQRRQRQSVETVRMLCAWHHREIHRAARRPPSSEHGGGDGGKA